MSSISNRVSGLRGVSDRLTMPIRHFWKRMRAVRLRTGVRIAEAVILLLLIYFLGGMFWIHEIDDDPDFAPPIEFMPPRSSHAVAIAAALVDREINRYRWTANDPFFMPAAVLDNMPSFQQGIIAAIARFTIELTDQIGRTRESSQADPDLEKALGLLKYSGRIWVFDFSTSFAPTATSEAQYQAGVNALQRYNQRLSKGSAVFDPRADNLFTTLARLETDIGSSSATIERHLNKSHATSSFVPDTLGDDIFYEVKGRLYAYFLILRDLQADYHKVIAERHLESSWAQMLETFKTVVELKPLVVTNGDPDGIMLPNHLAVQGFYLLRAITQLREIKSILLT